MKTILLATALFLAAITAGAVEPEPRKEADMEQLRADSLLGEADALFASSQYQAAQEKYEITLGIAREQFDHAAEVEALAQLARVNLIVDRKDDGRTWLKLASEKARASDPPGWTRFLGVRGRFEWQDDDLAAARQTFGELREYCTANAMWDRAVDAIHMLAIVAEKPQEQIEWHRRGIEMAEANDVQRWLGPLWNNLAGTYYDMNQFDSALSCYLKAREYHWRHSGEIGKLFADYHVGMTYRRLGKYEEAAQWLRPVLAWAERLDHHSALGQACQDLGEVQIATGNPAEGVALLKRAKEQYRKAGFDKTWPLVWENINRRLEELAR